MAAYSAGKLSKVISNKKCLREIFLTFTRNRESRYLGYYRHKISTPVHKKRQEYYRKHVLKPLEEFATLEERLLNADQYDSQIEESYEMNFKGAFMKDMLRTAKDPPDPVLNVEVDIGFTPKDKSRVPIKERLEWHKRMAKPIEGEITKFDLSEYHKEWLEGEGGTQLRSMADRFRIFKDLYEHGVFTPCVPLNVTYDFDENTANPVYMGNILPASDVSKVPEVNFNSKPDDLWTLILTNLDGHLLDTNSEYLHWFVGNIQGNEIKSGEVVCDYLQPFPMRGSGYHRLVFVLYKQDKKIDYSSLKKTAPCVSLKERTFKTFDFYKEHQDFLTPAGLAFFQCTWDESLTDFFHNVLNMREPNFEYIHAPITYRPQVQYPHKEPFNLYLDRYRDPKQIKKEVLLKRLQMVEPFKEEAPMPKYPCLHKPEGYIYSWQRQDFRLQRLRLGKYRDLRPHSVYPQEDNQFPYWDKH